MNGMGGMGIGMMLVWFLIIVVLVLLIVWLLKQIKKWDGRQEKGNTLPIHNRLYNQSYLGKFTGTVIHRFQKLWTTFPILSCSEFVDALVILAFYFIINLIRNDAFWLLNIRPADMLLLLALGLFTALLFEKWALQSGTWDYTSEMPVIFGIGLAPLIQLAILSIISIYLVKIAFGRRVARHN